MGDGGGLRGSDGVGASRWFQRERTGVCKAALIGHRNSSLRAVLGNCRASLHRCAELLQEHDLLPYLLRKSGADALDIADHFGDRLVVKTLPEQDRNLRGQRQHFRTIIEISRHLKFTEQKGGDDGVFARTTNLLGSFVS